MEAELTSLAVAGATALVTQMVTDGWEQARDRVVAFFTRGRDDAGEAVQAELEESRADLVAARDSDDEETAADVRDEWRLRLRRILRTDPSAAAELQALLDELRPPEDQPKGVVHNTISGGVQHGTVIQAHTIRDLTIGEPRQ
ncbi:hypothetical protein [Streptomyces acidicola]|uniref:Uncharacterized protein n=1 Tax=Streptomyces acidicola TaxID=2596892 RepID=A0A5N8WTW9_9ACTN|nr:hypothetical protein [Streptomyces acidicola]MPY50719.1 hypothetical protein [Streptomyces acidicola]